MNNVLNYIQLKTPHKNMQSSGILFKRAKLSLTYCCHAGFSSKPKKSCWVQNVSSFINLQIGKNAIGLCLPDLKYMAFFFLA